MESHFKKRWTVCGPIKFKLDRTNEFSDKELIRVAFFFFSFGGRKGLSRKPQFIAAPGSPPFSSISLGWDLTWLWLHSNFVFSSDLVEYLEI